MENWLLQALEPTHLVWMGLGSAAFILSQEKKKKKRTILYQKPLKIHTYKPLYRKNQVCFYKYTKKN